MGISRNWFSTVWGKLSENYWWLSDHWLHSCLIFYWLLLFFNIILYLRSSSCLLRSLDLIFYFFCMAFSLCSRMFLMYSVEQILNLWTSSFIFDLVASRGDLSRVIFYGYFDWMRVKVSGSASNRIIFLWKCCAFLGSNWI